MVDQPKRSPKLEHLSVAGRRLCLHREDLAHLSKWMHATGEPQSRAAAVRRAEHLLFLTVTHPRQLRTRGAISQVRSHVRGSRRASLRGRPPSDRPTEEVSRRQTIREVEQDPAELEKNVDGVEQPAEMAVQCFNPRAVGSSIDPFETMPSFSNPKLDVRQLAWLETRYHSIPGMEYVQSEEHINSIYESVPGWLSSQWIAAPIQDILDGIHGESETTLMVRSEAHAMINAGLQGPDPLSHEVTWMLIRLVVLEALNADYATLQLHLHGLEALVNRRGGLYHISDQDASLALTIEVLFSACVYEQQPNPVYLEFSASGCFSPAARRNPCAAPISPIHFVSSQQLQLEGCWCPPRTLQVLSTARMLTHTVLSRVRQDEDDMDAVQWTSMYRDLLLQPSARGPGSPMANDWVYEACRIAAIVYSTAIMYNIPLSAAYQHPQVLTYAPRPLASLGEALRLSDSYCFWGQMFGPLLWVALIASIAEEAREEESREEHVGRKHARLILSRCKVKSWVDGTMDSTLEAIRTFLAVQHMLGGV